MGTARSAEAYDEPLSIGARSEYLGESSGHPLLLLAMPMPCGVGWVGGRGDLCFSYVSHFIFLLAETSVLELLLMSYQNHLFSLAWHCF